jgi:hypothetical protein
VDGLEQRLLDPDYSLLVALSCDRDPDHVSEVSAPVQPGAAHFRHAAARLEKEPQKEGGPSGSAGHEMIGGSVARTTLPSAMWPVVTAAVLTKYRRRLPDPDEAEQNLVYLRRIGDDSDEHHLGSTMGTDQRIGLVHLGNQPCPC